MPKPGRKNHVNIELGGRIRAARLARGKTQSQVADKIGVTHAQVGYYESGRSSLSAERLVAIAHAIGVTPSGLVRGL